jgi:hypothetical protein
MPRRMGSQVIAKGELLDPEAAPERNQMQVIGSGGGEVCTASA